MKTKIISATVLAMASVSMMQFVSCSSAQNLDNDPAETANIDTLLVKGSPVVDSIENLPDCDSSNSAALYFVITDSTFQYCNGEEYIEYTIAGEESISSSCTVKTNLDETTTIRCSDGTSATIKNGSDGENGADGEDGTDGKNGTNGSNGSDGATGSSGSNGTDGDGCTMSDDGFGTMTMTCGDTQKSWPKAICDLGNSGGNMIPSKVSAALLDPSQVPYDPATQICLTGGTILSNCGDRPYSILHQICDTRDMQIYDFTVIGGQAWMSENLNYVEGTTWDPSSSSSSSKEFGQYYTFAQATASTNICPEGWTLPSTDAWQTLESSVLEHRGNLYDALEYFLMNSYSWTNSMEINSTGFDAFPSGMMESGSAEPTGTNGYAAYWTSNSVSATHAYSMWIENVEAEETPDVLEFKEEANKTNALSIRCVRVARDTEIKYWEWFKSRKSNGGLEAF